MRRKDPVRTKKYNCKARKQFRRQLRDQIRQCFREGRNPGNNLLHQARVLDVFAHWATMSWSVATSIIFDSAKPGRRHEREDELLFQAWTVVGNSRFRELVDLSRQQTRAQNRSRRPLTFETSSAPYHMTFRRYGVNHSKLPACVSC